MNIGALRAWARKHLEINPFYIEGGGTFVGIPDSWPTRENWNAPADITTPYEQGGYGPGTNPGPPRPGITWYISRPALLTIKQPF